MHPIFAQIPFKLADLEREHERLAVSETHILRNLAVGDEYERWVAKTSRAAGVESLFTGMESVLKLVLEAVNEKVFNNPADGQHRFHAQLRAQVATATDMRPAIISKNLHSKLDDLRKFRHLERNVYSDVLDDDKVEARSRAPLKLFLPSGLKSMSSSPSYRSPNWTNLFPIRMMTLRQDKDLQRYVCHLNPSGRRPPAHGFTFCS
jgi:hypothetical protein